MSWSDYLRKILERETAFDNIAISLDGERFETIPSILKASILLTDNLLDSGKKNMFIFPEQRVCSFVFMLLRTLHNIAEGKVSLDYDPFTFVPGEKLKLKNSVVEFDRIEIEKCDGRKLIYIKSVDGVHFGIPLETAPFLQHVKTKRLSKCESFHKEYKSFLEEHSRNPSKAFIQRLSDYKTHLESSSVFVAPILSTKDLLLNAFLNNERVSDLLLLAQGDIEGNIKNMGAGQLSGAPAIVLCQDLYAVCAAIEAGLVVNAIFIEVNQTIIDNQLDALDDLIAKDKSIVLLSDQVNFTDFSILSSRAFNIWTWNEKTITPQLYQDFSRVDVRVKNSGTKKIQYIYVLCPEVSNSILLLNKIKQLVENQVVAVVQVFHALFEISLTTLRAVVPLAIKTQVLGALEKFRDVIEEEKRYLSNELYEDLCAVHNNLETIYASAMELPKIGTLVELLKNAKNDEVIIIVPTNVDKNEVERFLENVRSTNEIDLIIVYPNEYFQLPESCTGLTIVSGWLNRNTMNKILNSNITPEINILVYEIEKRWKNGYIRNDMEKLKHSNDMNASILSLIDGSVANYYKKELDDIDFIGYDRYEQDFVSEELEEIELTLRQNKYRRYIISTGMDNVSAIPVSFVGDLISFYRTNRTLLTATKLINEDYDKIEEVKPAEIKTGDFIIEQEVQRDLIRDIADIILKNSNCFHLRKTARKWKDALEVEAVFYNEDTICEKLLKAGCTRGKITIHNWLTDDNMITPQSKEDITYIAKATEDLVLLEMIEQVFDAGRTIKNAHIQAGHFLADKLRANIAEALTAKGTIDGFNVWQPIDIEIEDIGVVKLLKVIDVGSELLVDATCTNKLIDTNKIAL